KPGASEIAPLMGSRIIAAMFLLWMPYIEFTDGRYRAPGVIASGASDYDPTNRKSYRAWLCYNQYRKYLIFEKIHPFIVTTDITNYFDSILFSRVSDSLHAVSAPPRMIGLLFFLLERLSIRDAFTECPRIGLPVDEFGCSRKLAHMVLFPHDDRVVAKYGEDAFIRWMDDQSIGVDSYAAGLRALGFIGNSLARLHLTPNAKKSDVLSLNEARRHFHLDLNQLLDDAEGIAATTPAGRRELSRKVTDIWRRAKVHEGIGHWDKILKRLYRFAALARVRSFRRRTVKDTLANPLLTGRIADYMRSTGSVSEYLEFANAVWSDDCQVYGDVNRVLVESLLRLEPAGADRATLRNIGSAMMRGIFPHPGAGECASVAPLILLRYGDRRSLPLLQRCFENKDNRNTDSCVRAAAIIYASYGHDHAVKLRRVASRMLRNHLSDMVKMLDAIEAYTELPDRFKQRIDTTYDAVEGQPFLDMRSPRSVGAGGNSVFLAEAATTDARHG
ncbi:MAG: RNA-directed DNA polymerase, partial [Phycisphaerae bacterium]